MFLKSLSLQHFRNYTKSRFEFSPQITFLVGQNAIGKTNLLEAVFLLAVGKSFHANLEIEMINYHQPLARIKGQIATDEEDIDLEIVLTQGSLNGEKTPRKKFLVNGVSRRLRDFQGNFYASLFGPWEIELTSGSPSARRRYLDFVLSQTDREYRRSLVSYEKGLRQRNKLLERIRDENLPRSQLAFWDRLIIKNGDYLTSSRESFINFLNDYFKSQPGELSTHFIVYDKSAISENRLIQYEKEEVAAGKTLVGPHRDDLIFEIRSSPQDTRNLASFGSRGEQRLTILNLKLGELAFIEEATGERPTLLLDDILSELDHSHRQLVMQTVDKQQTIITTSDPHYIKEFSSSAKVVELPLKV